MRSKPDRYTPALGFHALTTLYDPVVAITTRESHFKKALVAQTAIQPGEQVLDLACGTGTLTLMLQRSQPDARVVGIDGDAAVLQIARRKAEQAAQDIQFQQGLSTKLPYESQNFDRVVSSLLFHHLTATAKRKTFAEVRRVLKRGGELHVADWGRPHDVLMRLAFFGIQLLDGFDTTADNVNGKLPALMEEAGLSSVTETRRFPTVWGVLSLYRAHRLV